MSGHIFRKRGKPSVDMERPPACGYIYLGTGEVPDEVPVDAGGAGVKLAHTVVAGHTAWAFRERQRIKEAPAGYARHMLRGVYHAGMPGCAAEECVDLVRWPGKRGLCDAHWLLWRVTGTTSGEIPEDLRAAAPGPPW